jgi:non-ribosomal peptide synthetase component F
VVVVPQEVLKSPERFSKVLSDYEIERFTTIPSFAYNFLNYLNMLKDNKTKFLLSNLRMLQVSGETLTPKTVQYFFDYFDKGHHVLVNTYGCTEVCGDISWFEIRSLKQIKTFEKVPLGQPVPNTRIYILDAENQVLPDGEIGEICYSGAMIADGYVNDYSGAAFIENPLESDDRELKLCFLFQFSSCFSKSFDFLDHSLLATFQNR